MKGDGSVYRKANGKWAASLDLGPHPVTGKRKRKVSTHNTKPQAERALRDHRGRSATGDLSPHTDDKLTLSAFVEVWLRDSVEGRVKRNTARNYRALLRAYVLPTLGRYALRDLERDPARLQALWRNLSARGLAPNTVRAARQYLGGVFSAALKWGYVQRNPVPLTEAPKATPKRNIPWTLAEVRTLLEGAKGHRLEAFWTVALSLGLRKGEIAALRWEDVDLDRGTVHIKHTLYRVKGVGLVMDDAKTENSDRVIHLPSSLLTALRVHKQRQRLEKARAPLWEDTDFVFTTHRGQPLDPSYLNRTHSEVVSRAGLVHITIHDMRHLAVAIMLAQGIPLEQVSKVLGHSSIRVTFDIYGSVADEVLQDVARKVDNFFAV